MAVGLQFNMKKILLIIQARLGSTRFKNKVIKNIIDKPSIIYQVERIKQIKKDCEIIVGIPDNKSNDKLKQILISNKVNYFEGDEQNVFKRFLDCALKYNPDIIIRINGDCPLISPSSIDKTISTFFENPNADYVSTTLDKSYPIGEHVELFTLNALKIASKLELTHQLKEHVTPIFYKNQKIFNCINVKKTFNYPNNLRLCVDYEKDFKLICLIAKHFYPKINFDVEDIIGFILRNPLLIKINSEYKKSRTI